MLSATFAGRTGPKVRCELKNRSVVVVTLSVVVFEDIFKRFSRVWGVVVAEDVVSVELDLNKY